MTDRPLISVIIPHLNQPQALEACLRSLDAQSLERSLFEIIVVDNGSICVPEHLVASCPGTRLFRETRPGPGPARNLGIQHATGDILAFIDADCRAHPDWLRNALQKLINSPKSTILGGDVQIWRAQANSSTAIEAYESVFGYRFKLYIEQHGFCGTGNLVVRRADFEESWPFCRNTICRRHRLGAARPCCRFQISVRLGHDRFSSSTFVAGRTVREMGPPYSAFSQYGTCQTCLEGSVDRSRHCCVGITDSRFCKGTDERSRSWCVVTLKGDLGALRHPHASSP